MTSRPEPVDRDTGPIAWREAGSGPLVLFLHGLGGSRTAWDPQLTALADQYRCVAWDLPGYGRSAPIEPLTFASIADAVVDLLDVLGSPKAHLVGESFGGMQALHVAIRHPDRVGRMVLTNTSPAFGMNGTNADEWIRSRLGPLDAGATPADLAPGVLRAIAGPLLVGSRFDDRVAAFARIDADGLRAAVHCLPTNDVRADLGRITAPTLLVAGELDEETPVAYAQVLHDGLATSRLEILEGVGHLAAAEVPQQFTSLVRSFLSEGAG